MKIRCEHCGYSWDTKTRLGHVTCPSCMVKIKAAKPREREQP